MIVDAASFVVSAACLLTIRRPEPPPEPVAGPRGARSLLAGWHQVARSPLLRQAITPPGLLGRVNAVVRLVGWAVRRVRQTPDTEPAWTLVESPSHS